MTQVINVHNGRIHMYFKVNMWLVQYFETCTETLGNVVHIGELTNGV